MAVPRLHLVEPWGEPLSAPSNRAVQPLALRHPVLRFGGRASSPLARFRSLHLRDLLLEVCKGPRVALRVPPPGPRSSAIPPRGRLALPLKSLPIRLPFYCQRLPCVPGASESR